MSVWRAHRLASSGRVSSHVSHGYMQAYPLAQKVAPQWAAAYARARAEAEAGVQAFAQARAHAEAEVKEVQRQRAARAATRAAERTRAGGFSRALLPASVALNSPVHVPSRSHHQMLSYFWVATHAACLIRGCITGGVWAMLVPE